MTAELFDATLARFIQARPFRVFVIELHGGTRYEIDYPGAITYRGGMAAFLIPGGGPAIFDHESVNQIFLGAASQLPPLPGANTTTP